MPDLIKYIATVNANNTVNVNVTNTTTSPVNTKEVSAG